MDDRFVSWLFDTDALRVCPEGEPFWYTSGKFGPFYINTHFLAGGEAAAAGLLTDIEAEVLNSPMLLPQSIGGKLEALRREDPRFDAVIQRLAEVAREGGAFDFISGGERRDWIFSLPVARALSLPHLSIFKNLSAVYTDALGETKPAQGASLSGKRALHIADLVTEASSYTRAWIPAVEALDARIAASVVVVDRDQGGEEILAEKGIDLRSLVTISPVLFEEAVTRGKITPAQRDMARDFLLDPAGFMRRFLRAHPNYLGEQIALGGKARERAERCISMGYDKL